MGRYRGLSSAPRRQRGQRQIEPWQLVPAVRAHRIHGLQRLVRDPSTRVVVAAPVAQNRRRMGVRRGEEVPESCAHSSRHPPYAGRRLHRRGLYCLDAHLGAARVPQALPRHRHRHPCGHLHAADLIKVPRERVRRNQKPRDLDRGMDGWKELVPRHSLHCRRCSLGAHWLCPAAPQRALQAPLGLRRRPHVKHEQRALHRFSPFPPPPLPSM
eukprot:Amastigsp_a508493_631.p2 type:complete len:213 gc:universal Amastigsp_a508493_631:653-15(-)